MHEPFFGRDNDTAGVGIGFAQVSNNVTGLDLDTAFYNPGVYSPVRTSETFLEATYQYQVTPWWQIQPDAQYVFNPGGGIVNPNDPTQKIKNETVLGCAPTSPSSAARRRARTPLPPSRRRRGQARRKRPCRTLDETARSAPLLARRRRPSSASRPRAPQDVLEDLHHHTDADHHGARQRRPESLRGRRRAGLGGQDQEGRRAGRQFQQLVQPARHRQHDRRLQSRDQDRRRCSPRCRAICRNARAASA